jgi:hypothetical protein
LTLTSDGRMTTRMIRFPAAFAVGLALLQACAPTVKIGDDVSYVRPPGVLSGPSILRVSNEPSWSLPAVQRRLARAGFTLVERDFSARVLRMTSDRLELVDCGQLTQTALGATAGIDGNAALAVIFDSDSTGGIVRREVTSTTEVTVTVGPALEDGTALATLEEAQSVTIKTLSPDRSQELASETRDVVTGGAVSFADGTICRSSGRLVDAFR